MVKPFLEYTDRKVIASGGVIRIANSCKIEDGKLIEVNFPDETETIVSNMVRKYAL